jgi:hypothetical protein
MYSYQGKPTKGREDIDAEHPAWNKNLNSVRTDGGQQSFVEDKDGSPFSLVLTETEDEDVCMPQEVLVMLDV